MDYVYGLFVYEHAACFDFTGPLDVFNISNSLVKKGRVLTIAAKPGGRSMQRRLGGVAQSYN